MNWTFIIRHDSFSMEICRMDKQSHFNLGMNSDRMFDANYNFNEITNCDEASSSYSFEKDQTAVRTGYTEYNGAGGSSWKDESVECKQEADPAVGFQNPINENSSEYNEDYQFDASEYDQIENSFSDEASALSRLGPERPRKTLHEHRTGPYQISSMKNQLPSWYHPSYAPSHPPSFFQHQYPYHQGSLIGPPSTPTDHNMRSMIHLSGRYYYTRNDYSCTSSHPFYIIWLEPIILVLVNCHFAAITKGTRFDKQSRYGEKRVFRRISRNLAVDCFSNTPNETRIWTEKVPHLKKISCEFNVKITLSLRMSLKLFFSSSKSCLQSRLTFRLPSFVRCDIWGSLTSAKRFSEESNLPGSLNEIWDPKGQDCRINENLIISVRLHDALYRQKFN